MIRSIVITVLLSCCFNLLTAQINDKGVKKSFIQLYHYKFDDAEKTVDSLSNKNKGSLAALIAELNFDYWSLISGDSVETNYTIMKERIVVGIDMLKDEKELNNEQILSLIYLYAQKARIDIAAKKYMAVLSDMNKSIKYIKKGFDLEEEYEYFTFTTGIYNYFMALGMENNSMLKTTLILFPKADKELGLKKIIESTKSADQILKTESSFFLMMIYLESERKPAMAKKYADYLINTYPDNLLFNFFYIRTLLKMSDNQNALDRLKKVRQKHIKNSQISIKQKIHFINIVKNSLQNISGIDYN